MVAEEVAERYRCSVRTVHELTRTKAIPHRKLAGTRRCLFLEAELEAWEGGAELEVVADRGDGHRIVKPKGGGR
jgi:excisionase family DNA binding protein